MLKRSNLSFRETLRRHRNGRLQAEFNYEPPPRR